MSKIIQGGAASNSFLRASDNRHYGPQVDKLAGADLPDRPFEAGRLWPGPRGLGYQFADLFTADAGNTGLYEAPAQTFGGQSMLQIAGVTKNAGGTPIGGVTVSLFLTTGKVWVRDYLSAADGSFIAYSQYASQNHFIVAFLAGSPDTGGTTTYALVPS